ncbi:MAG: class I SAM-dependent methyltransferase [Candidatus Promineifilaceae bacterium]|nr:class I SAM-dependent methyltransferase [Candidatus Promineifilaceae bacterium]
MYAALARYYDLLHDQLSEDLDFVLDLAANYGDPVLELGCGTGRLLLPLVRAGYIVTGVDNEEAMLMRARQRLVQEKPEVRRRAAFIQADVRNLVMPQNIAQYGLAIFSYNTLFHFRPSEVQQALRGIRKLLRQDGRVFIDLANPFLIEGSEYEEYPVVENSFTDPTTGRPVVQTSLSSLDPVEQCLQTTWLFETGKESKQPVEAVSVEINYWYYFPHQMELLLQQAGFQLDQIKGDYDHSDFHEESSRLLILASLQS